MKTVPTISLYKVLKNRKSILKNPLPFHHANFEKHGDTFKVNLGKSNTWVFTRNAESIRYILQKNHKNYGKSHLQTKDLAKYVGHGLLTSNGEFWRVHSRMIQPAFHKKKLEGLFQIMFQAIQTGLESLKTDVKQDVFPHMGDLAFQVVAQSLFSADDIGNKMQKLKSITISNQEMLIKEMRLPYLKWWFHLKGEIRGHLKQSEVAKGLLNSIIQERIDSGEEKDDLLDMLLAARYEDGSPMSRKQLIDEVLILFTAGHETTANALSFTLFLLAKHTHIQEKLFKEVDLIDFDDNDLMSQLGKLRYTKQCIEESMRLFPPAYFFDRVSLDNDTLNGYEYKKNTVWLMSIYELHRHPDYWKDANEFMPERFDPEKKNNFSDYYFPFGAGPRMCIGNNFAMFEMIFTVALLIKKYRLQTEVERVEINPLITLKPKEVILRFSARKKERAMY